MLAFRSTLMLCALLLLTACASGGVGGSSGASAERRAEALAARGNFTEAADRYIGLAALSEGEQRDRLTLLAVENWLDAGDGRRARSAFREVAKPAGGDNLWLWNTDAAALLLVDGRPDDALAILERMSGRSMASRHRIRAESLRADAWLQKDQPKRAVEIYLQLDDSLSSRNDVERNRARLWAGLKVSRPQSMRAAAEISSDSVTRGWLSLGALAAATGEQGIGWSSGVRLWIDDYPGHPALTILDDIAAPGSDDLRHPGQVALLLPVSGKNASAGKAVQNGFFAAYFAAAPALQDVQSITIYDVADANVEAAYTQAVNDGADFVVGPLLRGNVEALAAQPVLPVPVLALNYLPDGSFAPAGFYQFALAPEDEAVSAANRAVSDGGRFALALYPNNDWGRRVMNSFATEFESRGGVLLDHADYQAGVQDFSLEIESLMGLSHSVGRYKRLRANLGEPLQFDPRRRQDVDFVFLAADSKVGRLVKSQLKFHYSGDLPVYSTSFIYSMDDRSNRDLNGIMFADTPWTISPPPWIADYPPLFAEFWPSEKRMGRLHAMGYDSYNLVSALFSSTSIAEIGLAGATGELFLDANNRVRRHLAWAQFVNGLPVPLNNGRPTRALETHDGDEADEPIEDDAGNEPSPWPLQTLNQ